MYEGERSLTADNNLLGRFNLSGILAARCGVPSLKTVFEVDAVRMDSLLSIVQIPRGVPVAIVAIQNATNAGLLAIWILGSTDSNLQERIIQYQIDMIGR